MYASGSYAAIKTFDVIESLQSHLQSSLVAATERKYYGGGREGGKREGVRIETLSATSSLPGEALLA